MDKSPDAFRTISEVAEVLDTPAHVLRFWESRFPQIRPVKRAGGRRYYRPTDVALLTGIKHLLHDEGMTIRGVQKILREQGVRHVAGLSGQDIPDEGEDAEAALEAALAANFGGEFAKDSSAPMPQAEVETAQIVALETALRARDKEARPPESSDARVTEPTPLRPLADSAAEFAEATAQPSNAEVMPPFDPGQDFPMPGDQSPPVAPEAPVTDDTEAAHWLDPELDPDLDLNLDPDLTQGEDPDLKKPDLAAPYIPPPLAADAPLVLRLRALPPGCFAESPDAQSLAHRLRLLAARVAAPPTQAPL